MIRRPQRSTLLPYTALSRSVKGRDVPRGARFSVLRRASARRAGSPQAEACGGTLKRAPQPLNVPPLMRVCIAVPQFETDLGHGVPHLGRQYAATGVLRHLLQKPGPVALLGSSAAPPDRKST